MFLEDTPAVLSPGTTSAKITGIITIGPVVKNHISSKMAGRSIATQGTAYPSMSLVYRQVLQLHLHLLLLHLHRWILWLPRNIQQHQEVKVRVKKYRGNLSHGSADTENPNKNDSNEELQSDLLQDVPDWLQEFKGNLVDGKCSRTPRVLLMNCLQSREQKWYRASTVFTLTSRRTEIATSAWELRLQELLAEDVLVHSYPERKISVI